MPEVSGGAAHYYLLIRKKLQGLIEILQERNVSKITLRQGFRAQ
jgi:hypothetical protein